MLSLGQTFEGGQEMYLRLAGPLGAGDPALAEGAAWLLGFSISSRGEAWLGAGLGYAVRLQPHGLFVRASFMPGLYRPGTGTDLGGPIEFRSMLELGMLLSRGAVTLSIDHRSNGGLYRQNPGMEVVALTWQIPLSR